MRRLLSLYPRAWRERYGEEFEGLLEQERITPLLVLNVVGGALDARIRLRHLGAPPLVAVAAIQLRGVSMLSSSTLITPRTIATLLHRRREMDAQLESLTPREREVLRLMARGVSSRDIAGLLGISYTTVRTHIRSLGGKLGVHSKLEAIVKARELALVE